MARKVMVYHSGQAGAPIGAAALTAAVGTINTILTACLVTGFNIQPIANITQSGGIATAQTSNAQHGYEVGGYVDISGSTVAAYNGRQKVIAKTANSFTFAVPANTTSPASGTMSAITGGAGWTKPYQGDNGGVFRTEPGSLGISVAINDNNPNNDGGTSFTAQQLYQATGYPDAATQKGELITFGKIARSGVYINTGGNIPVLQQHDWLLVADGRTCYLILFGNIYDAGNQPFMHHCMIAFGEFQPIIPGDQFAHFINRGKNNGAIAAGCDVPNNSVVGLGAAGVNTFFPFVQPNSFMQDGSMGMAFMRPYTGLSVAALGFPFWATRFVKDNVSMDPTTAMIPYQDLWPGLDPIPNALPLVPIFVSEKQSYVRGRLRGVYYPLGQMTNDAFAGANFLTLDESLTDTTSRQVLVAKVGQVSSLPMQIAFNIGDEW